MTAAEYFKTYACNGRRVKIEQMCGPWAAVRSIDPATTPEYRKELAHAHKNHSTADFRIELEQWTHGVKTVYAGVDWHEIMRKMGDSDASAHLLVVLGLTAWVAVMQLCMQFGVI